MFNIDQQGCHDNYVSVLVTLTSASVVYSVAELVKAIAAKCPLAGSIVFLQAAPTNANGSIIYLGDASVSSTRYAFAMSPGDSKNYSNPQQSILFGNLHVKGSVDGLKLAVEVMAQ